MAERLVSCRVHEALSPNARNQATPAMALSLTDYPWSIGELLDAALAVATPDLTETALSDGVGSG